MTSERTLVWADRVTLVFFWLTIAINALAGVLDMWKRDWSTLGLRLGAVLLWVSVMRYMDARRATTLGELGTFHTQIAIGKQQIEVGKQMLARLEQGAGISISVDAEGTKH